MKQSLRSRPTSTVPEKNRPARKDGAGALPNSALIDIFNTGPRQETGSLEQTMLSRLPNAGFRQAQIPEAEREADRLAVGVRGATPEAVADNLGRKLGADFSGVRFHTDAASARRTDAMGGAAYTAGQDVYFGSQGFDAETAAHELVHTVQQGAVIGGGVSVSAPLGGIQMKWWNPFSWFGKKDKNKESTPKNTPPGSGDLQKQLRGSIKEGVKPSDLKPKTVEEKQDPSDYGRVSAAKQRVSDAKNALHTENVREKLRYLEGIRAALEELINVAGEYTQTGSDKDAKKKAKAEIKSARSELKGLKPQLKAQQQAEITRSKTRKEMTVGKGQKRSIEGMEKVSAMGGISLLQHQSAKRQAQRTEYFKKGHQPLVQAGLRDKGKSPGSTFTQLDPGNGMGKDEIGDNLLDIMGEADFTMDNVETRTVGAGDNERDVEVGTLDTEKREVAVSVVASLMGMGGVIAQSRFGKVTKDNGDTTSGVLIEEAKGASPTNILASQGLMVGECYDINAVSNTNAQDKIKSASGSVQRDLMSMQLFDTICGQIDRHHGNMNFQGLDISKDGNGKKQLHGDSITGVTGFDQDLSFGSADMHQNQNRYGVARSIDDGGELTLPFLDKKFANRVLETDAGALRKALSGLLPKRDIESAVTRLKTVQAAIKKEMKNPTGKLLDDDEWGEETHKMMLGDVYDKEQKAEPHFTRGYEVRKGVKNPRYLRDLNQYQKTMGLLARGGMLSDDFHVEGIGGGEGKLKSSTREAMEKAKKKKK